MDPTNKTEVIQNVALAATPVSLLSAPIFGISLDDWVKLAGLGFIVLQAMYLIWRWRREWKRKQRDTKPGDLA